MKKKFFGWKKIWVKKKKFGWKKKFGVKKKFWGVCQFFFSKNKSCLKLPELTRNYIWGGSLGVGGGAEVLPWTDNQTDNRDHIAEWLVESLLASSKARLKKEGLLVRLRNLEPKPTSFLTCYSREVTCHLNPESIPLTASCGPIAQCQVSCQRKTSREGIPELQVTAPDRICTSSLFRRAELLFLCAPWCHNFQLIVTSLSWRLHPDSLRCHWDFHQTSGCLSEKKTPQVWLNHDSLFASENRSVSMKEKCSSYLWGDMVQE